MEYTYYPGCSLKGTNTAYEESVLAVFSALGVKLTELDDWNCCGATAYMAVDEMRAVALAARNLAMAEALGRDLLVPCSGCWLVLKKAKRYIEAYPEIRAHVAEALGQAQLSYNGQVRVRHPLDVILNDVGLDTVRKHVRRPLEGLKVVPYYGCQIVRPFAVFDHQIYPSAMDQLLAALGAEVCPYPLKTRCCGGSLTGTITDVGERLVFILLREAKKCGGDLISVLCPLCHFNLDSYQDEAGQAFVGDCRIPTVYFTQLMGLAMGLPSKALGLERNIVSPMPVLEKFVEQSAVAAL